jgi:hypothetical protein
MTRSSRRIGRTKAIAAVLAMIADASPEPVPARESDEWLSQTALGFCAAMDGYSPKSRRPSRD